jgi:hypothetical protein
MSIRPASFYLISPSIYLKEAALPSGVLTLGATMPVYWSANMAIYQACSNLGRAKDYTTADPLFAL